MLNLGHFKTSVQVQQREYLMYCQVKNTPRFVEYSCRGGGGKEVYNGVNQGLLHVRQEE